MKARNVGLAIAGTALIAVTMGVIAAEDIGKREYDNNCAVCHGASGKGDGPYAGIINTKVPDLTVLQKSNGGVFPFNRVYETIDGRYSVLAHGARDMPIWGNEYNEKAAEFYGDYIGEYNPVSFVRGRILALVNHIFEMQEK